MRAAKCGDEEIGRQSPKADAPHRPEALPGDAAMRRRRPLLPVLPAPVSPGEGGAPPVPLRHLPGVRINDERANPTGSFKDRMASPAVSWARDRGFGTVAVASTGHAAVSTAAYAAAAWAVRHGRDDGYAPS